MGEFLDAERERQARFRAASATMPSKAAGLYKGRPRSFCLPPKCSEQNLFLPIRKAVLKYFGEYCIHWHEDVDGGPSNHLCDSQVCCVNFLYPFVHRPDALAALLRPVFPGIHRVLPMGQDGRFLAFEWIGEENYLHELVPRGECRQRGRYYTSADAAVLFENEDATRQIVLIEWKYAESYPPNRSTIFSRNGTDRRRIYRPLYQRGDFPADQALLPGGLDSLFYEPFDQLFRQQCLAREMERAGEHGARSVSVLHIAPSCNRDFLRVTSPDLACLGPDVITVWKRLVRRGDRFASIATEDLFGQFPVGQFAELQEWWDYVTTRYAWVR